jgi:ankyrin repeat protein
MSIKGAENILNHALIMVVVFIVLSGNLYSQQTFIVMDTSEYQVYPEGLNLNLSIAASKGYVFEINRLAKMGADINNRDIIGATPLIYAVANKQPDAVEALLKYSPDPDILTYDGESALHIAAKSDYLEIAEILIRDSADINIRDKINCTPLHFASLYNYYYMTDLLIYYEAEIDPETLDGTTPLMAAVWAGNAEIADILIQNGADVNHADTDGYTPILIAAQFGDTLLTRLLIDYGADIGQYTKAGYDIGALAARSGSTEYSDYIIKKTDWLNKRKADATDPLIVARKAGKKETYEIFKELSAKSLPLAAFDRVSLTAAVKINGDIYTGAFLSFIEPFHRIKINAGMEFKPAYTKVLVEKEENVFWQYDDKRFVLFAGLGKQFLINDSYFNGTVNIIADLNFGYMMARNYKGTYEKPPDKFIIMPSIGVERTIKNISFSGTYEYMNTDLYKRGPHWIKFGFSYYINFKGKMESLKNIDWY